MKKFFVLAIVVVVSFVLAVSAFAVPAGKVVFDGKVHADKGAKCADCHQSGLFKMKKGETKATMKDMEAGKACGGCHNGTKAFGVKDAAKCGSCHKK